MMFGIKRRFLQAGKVQSLIFLFYLFCSQGTVHAGYDDGYGYPVISAFALLPFLFPDRNGPLPFLPGSDEGENKELIAPDPYYSPNPYHAEDGEEWEYDGLGQDIQNREAQYKTSSGLVCNEFGIWLRLARVGDGLADIHEVDDSTANDPPRGTADGAPVLTDLFPAQDEPADDRDWEVLARVLEDALQYPPLPEPDNNDLGSAFPWSAIISCGRTFRYRGYDLFSTKNEEMDDYHCAVCTELAVEDGEPQYLVECGGQHTLCKSCLGKCEAARKGQSRCPECREEGQYRTDTKLMQRFRRVTVKCPRKCGEELTTYDLDSHLRQCKEREECSFCCKPIPAEQLMRHQLQECLGKMRFESQEESSRAFNRMAQIMETVMDTNERSAKRPRLALASDTPSVKDRVSIESFWLGELELCIVPGMKSDNGIIECYVCINREFYKDGYFFSLNLADPSLYQYEECKGKIGRTIDLRFKDLEYRVEITLSQGTLSFYQRFMCNFDLVMNDRWTCTILLFYKINGVLRKAHHFYPVECSPAFTQKEGWNTLVTAADMMSCFRRYDNRFYFFFELSK